MSYLSSAGSGPRPWYVRLILWLQRRHYGRELAPSLLWSRTPRVFAALSLLYGAIDRRSSPLDAGLRSLVQVRVSQINGCAFCTDINGANGLKRGVPAEKLSVLAAYADSPHFTAAEKAALHFAETVTDSRRRSEPSQIEELSRHFSDDTIIELAALIAFQNMSSKFNAALGVPSQGFCSLPPAIDRDGK